jgi:hypothetical protein
MPEARQVIVHHNRFHTNRWWGVHVYTPVIDRPPQNITLLKNQFILNGELPVRLEGAKGIYLVDNIYRNNNQCYDRCWSKLEVGESGLLVDNRTYENGVLVTSDAYVCAGTQDDNLPVFGGPVTTISGGVCDGFDGNAPPVARDDTASVYAGSPTSIIVAANDSDPDGDAPLVSRIVEMPDHGSARRDGDSVVYTSTPGYEGVDTFTYEISDAFGATDQAQVSVTVLPPPSHPPVAVADTTTAVTATDTSIDVLANDSDPNGVRIEVTEIIISPEHGGAIIDGEKIVYTSDADYQGWDRLTYEIANIFGKTDTAGVLIEVIPPPNRAPRAVNDTTTTSLNTFVVVDVLSNDSDPDGDEISLDSIVRVPINGWAVITDSNITYIPNDNFSGADAFRYRIIDGRGGYGEGIVYVEILNPNATDPAELPDAVVVEPAYPNPATGAVVLPLTLGEAFEIDVTLFDVLGQEVLLLHRGMLSRGRHAIRFDVGRLSAGQYFLRLRADERIEVFPLEVLR